MEKLNSKKELMNNHNELCNMPLNKSAIDTKLITNILMVTAFADTEGKTFRIIHVKTKPISLLICM
jgi:hypothetical protein